MKGATRRLIVVSVLFVALASGDVFQTFVVSESDFLGFPAQLVNADYPGPAVWVDEGEHVSINVINELRTQVITVHWHGLLQQGTPQMDGTYMISECGIPPGRNFTYSFKALSTGTKWWHAHVSDGAQAGIVGAFVVRALRDPHGDLFQREDVIALADWPSAFGQAELTLLVNGRVADGSSAVVAVPRLQCTRFRIIHMGTRALSITFSVSSHQLTVVAVDGVDVLPAIVDAVTLYIGERVDAVLCATQAEGNYQISLTAHASGSLAAHNAAAVLHYDTAPAPSQANLVTATAQNPTVLDIMADPSGVTSFNTAGAYMVDMPVTMDLGCLSKGKCFGSMSHVPFELPDGVLLHTKGMCGVDETTNAMVVERMDGNPAFVEVVLNNLGPLPVPMHLHGHRFQIVATGAGTADFTTPWTNPIPASESLCPGRLMFARMGDNSSTSWGCAYTKDAASGRLNLQNPLVKDTFAVAPHTWAVIRFRSDNAGPWPLHSTSPDFPGMEMIFMIAPPEFPEATPGTRLCSDCGMGVPEPCYVDADPPPPVFSFARDRTTVAVLGAGVAVTSIVAILFAGLLCRERAKRPPRDPFLEDDLELLPTPQAPPRASRRRDKIVKSRRRPARGESLSEESVDMPRDQSSVHSREDDRADRNAVMPPRLAPPPSSKPQSPHERVAQSPRDRLPVAPAPLI